MGAPMQVFGAEPSCSSYLQQLLATLFARTTANLSTLQASDRVSVNYCQTQSPLLLYSSAHCC